MRYFTITSVGLAALILTGAPVYTDLTYGSRSSLLMPAPSGT